ncbi:MAG: apolipoprotein N-acyltransferase [Thermodesulfovibrio sp.]|nr:apolipoprotein N-acyltransferase [Thermodesulfovibrio sp.]
MIPVNFFDCQPMFDTIKEKLIFYAPAAASGILLTLAFPAYDFYLLAWAGFIPLLLSLWGRTQNEAFRTGFVFGVTFFFSTLFWIYNSIHVFGGIPFAASLAIVFLLCLFLGLYPALFAYLFLAIIRKTKLPALLAAPVVWVTLEFLRSYALTGFPWASIGYSQYRFLSVIQVADITGIYGISFLVLAVNGAVVDFVLIKRKLREMPLYPVGYATVGLLALGLALIASLGYGTWRLGQTREHGSFSVSIVQGNIEQDKKWEPAFQKEVLDIYFDLSKKAAEASPQLIIWPETAIPFLFNYDAANTEKLTAMQQSLKAYLLFGSVMLRERTKEKALLTNSALLLDPSGKLVYKYDKIHLVPFGEYVPLQRMLFFIDKLVTGIGDYVPGESYVKAGTDFGGFGTMICYEIIFPGLVRKFFTKGGDFMVTMTNDAWFGRTAGPYQHFAMAVFRAIENRKPVVRAANTGVSGLIDSSGRITASTPVFTRQILPGVVKMDNTLTFYTKYGDIFSYLCLVVFVIIVLNVKIWR